MKSIIGAIALIVIVYILWAFIGLIFFLIYIAIDYARKRLTRFWQRFKPVKTIHNNYLEISRLSKRVEIANRSTIADTNLLIEYADADGVITNRVITPQIIYRENNVLYIRAFCRLRNDLRTFRVDRILAARNLKTNQEDRKSVV